MASPVAPTPHKTSRHPAIGPAKVPCGTQRDRQRRPACRRDQRAHWTGVWRPSLPQSASRRPRCAALLNPPCPPHRLHLAMRHPSAAATAPNPQRSQIAGRINEGGHDDPASTHLDRGSTHRRRGGADDEPDHHRRRRGGPRSPQPCSHPYRGGVRRHALRNEGDKRSGAAVIRGAQSSASCDLGRPDFLQAVRNRSWNRSPSQGRRPDAQALPAAIPRHTGSLP